MLAAGLAAAAAGCMTESTSGSAHPAAAAGPTSAATHRPTGRPATAPRPAPSSARPPAPAGPAVEIVTGPRTRAEVALTFHGAGDPLLAEQVLAAVERAGARITVLAVGTWLAANPALASRIVGAGHELGNHTWTHPALDDLPAPAVRDEIDRCRDLIARLTGSPGAHVRQSAAQHSTPLVREIAGQAGYPVCLSYDVDSLDWTDPGPVAIRQNVAAGVQPGSVVSMHFGHPGTLAALPAVLADLAGRGLNAVTATTLLRP